MREMNLDYISLGTHRYTVEKLNPMDAFDWGPRALALFGPSLGNILSSVDMDALTELDFKNMGLAELAAKVQQLVASTMTSCGELKCTEVSAMLRDAVQRCYTPQNESLADMAVFNSWFREHPGDLFPLGAMALVQLVKDFFPSQLAIAASAFLKKARQTQGTASVSPTDGKDEPLQDASSTLVM